MEENKNNLQENLNSSKIETTENFQNAESNHTASSKENTQQTNIKQSENQLSNNTTINQAEEQTKQLANSTQSDFITDDQFEKSSYLPSEYKRVAKVRAKGKMFGIDVPYLQFQLTKPQKTRISFSILAVLFSILAIAIFISTVVLAVFSIIPAISAVAGGITETSAELKEKDILGLGILSGIIDLSGFLAICILLAILALLIALIYYFSHQASLFFKFSKANREEIAKGPQIGQMLFTSAIWFVSILAIIILIIVQSTNKTALFSSPAIYIAFAILFAVSAMWGIVLYQKLKESKHFATLPQNHQKSYLEHSKMLRQVKLRQKAHNKTSVDLFS